MALYVVRSELVQNPPHGMDATRRHGEHVDALLRAARIDARWVETRTSFLNSAVVDVIDARDDRTAQAAADVIALAHASVEEAA